MANVLNIAHRGARSLAPENTLAAAQKAVELEADMWELDVSVSADGALLLMHDDSLARTTNAPLVFPERDPWQVSDFNLADLKRLEAGSFFVRTDPFGQIAAGAISLEEQARMAQEPIPTLREALLFTRDHGWQVNVEIKELPATLSTFPVVQKVLELIEALDMVEQVLLSSFVHPYLQQAKRLNPALKTAALTEQANPDPVALLRELESKVYHPYFELTNEEEIKQLRQANFEVNVWTVNRVADMKRLIQAGVTGIITDFPQLLKPLLTELSSTGAGQN